MESQNAEAEPNGTTASSLVLDHKNTIYELTKSNHIMFLCLSLFFERHKKGSWFKNLITPSSSSKKTYNGVHQHAGDFFLVESSLKVSSAGIAITNVAISLQSTRTRSKVQTIQFMRRLEQQAKECRSEAHKMQKDFRELRGQMMNTYKQAGITAKGYTNQDVTYDNIDALRNMTNIDLSKLLIVTITQVVQTIGKLVAWWDNAVVDWDNILRFMVCGELGFMIAEWKALQLGYQLYNEEIMVQEDYYKSELQHALPSRGFLERFKK
ncbi:hypothetical protein BDN71DRAFT_1453696 [Pleurotus eryngii]|uniref:Uncharacterized protein n=1 Tax=Pleurotus eryngii TaxID=5323 RepID=A0A9P5ZMB7_PLEER|nr:hypothetical protein BDN71DRAFT_1453696 [Pleurotus eryngii]